MPRSTLHSIGNGIALVEETVLISNLCLYQQETFFLKRKKKESQTGPQIRKLFLRKKWGGIDPGFQTDGQVITCTQDFQLLSRPLPAHCVLYFLFNIILSFEELYVYSHARHLSVHDGKEDCRQCFISQSDKNKKKIIQNLEISVGKVPMLRPGFPGRESNFFSSTKHLDQLCDPPNWLNVLWNLAPGDSGRSLQQNTHLPLAPVLSASIFPHMFLWRAQGFYILGDLRFESQYR